MKISQDILQRFFAGNCSRNDYRLVHRQFSAKEDREELRKLLEKHWMEFDPADVGQDETFDNMLHRLHHQLHLEESKKTIRLSRFQWIQRIAAILFIPLLLSFLAYLYVNRQGNDPEAYAEIRSPLSGKTHFVLPDGTSGFLNNGSVLKYPLAFNQSRQVDLVGEACFDVAHNGKPFHVLTKTLDIKVMGTTFNVIAYDDDLTEEVVLQSGKVQVSSKSGNKLAILEPDQKVTISLASNKVVLRQVDASQYTAWTKGKLVFRNESLDLVVKRLSRWYNVDFDLADPELLEYTFHATFMDERLDEVLKLLSLTTPISYETEKRRQPAGSEVTERQLIKLKQTKETKNRIQQ
ncbi:FecR family protein [Gaoshiqia sp. Z1-71]|uniref:FecR family protein n=1 Tax=Gaoshiqia hydrogeniformans TaxID=3290090 RepID=UPI003BF8E38B